MSRIGKKPVPFDPKTVRVGVSADGRHVTVQGPRGAMQLQLTGTVTALVDQAGNEVRIQRGSDLRADRAKHGLYRALLANMVQGVTKGYETRLEIQGVGFRAQLASGCLLLYVGYNNKVPERFPIPKGVEVKVEGNTAIVVSGNDKQLVGQVAAQIRQVRLPDVYKGKGIRYHGEVVRKLPGKTVGVAAAK
jgi:large subunit ribosomal protein L6